VAQVVRPGADPGCRRNDGLNISIGRVSSNIGTRIGKELREILQTKLLKLNVEYFDRHSAEV